MAKIKDLKVEMVCEGELFFMIKELNERLKKLTSDNSDYAKCLECAEDITARLDLNIREDIIAKIISEHFT
jgi:hypothetical protein